MHAWLLIKQNKEGGLKIAWVAGWFLMKALACRPAWAKRTLQPSWELGCEIQKRFRHKAASEHTGGTAISGAYRGRAAGIVQISGPSGTTMACAKVCTLIHANYPCHLPWSSIVLIWGKRASAEKGESVHLEGMEPALTRSSGLLLQHGIETHLQEGGDGHQAEGKLCLITGFSPSSSTSSPTSYQGDRYQHALRKHHLCSCQTQLSHQSHWVQTDCIGMLPHKDTPLRPQ